MDGCRIRRAENPYSIHLTIVHCLNCSRSSERQQRRAFRIHAGLAKDLFGGSSSAASRPRGACLEAKPKSGLVLDGRQPPMASRAYRAGLATSCCIWIF